jgi:hypothetical protein
MRSEAVRDGMALSKTRVSFSIDMRTKKRMESFKFIKWSEYVEVGLNAVLLELEKDPKAHEKYGLERG